MSDKPTVIDLFCGAGGLSLGFLEEGYDIIGAIDVDTDSIDSFTRNHPSVSNVFLRNLHKYRPKSFANDIGEQKVDLIIGGPPCQGFSTASMNPEAKPNFGPKSRYDVRNVLYRRFFDFVNCFKPSCFVMENVPGLKARGNGHYRKQVVALGAKLGYNVEIWELVAAKYGVPQLRKRVFFIGTPKDTSIRAPKQTHYPPETLPDIKYISVGEAILDLPILTVDDGFNVMDYDSDRIQEFESNDEFNHDYARWARENCNGIHHHVSRNHNDRDLRIFQLIKPGKSSAHLSTQQQKLITYKLTSFKDKYRRQPIYEPSTTITAHLAKDGLYYIHPTQNRSLTPREAARLQSFQDRFIFSGKRTSIYKQIGNAVPPLLARAIAKEIKNAF